MFSSSAALLFFLHCYCHAVSVVISQSPRAIGTTNVLVLLGDDTGKDIGIYGHAQVKSPNLDELASHSMVFNYGYTSVSSCSPSRSAILTGLPVHQNGMYGLEQGVHHFASFDADTHQHPETVGRLLAQSNRYYTGIIGKYHVAPIDVYYFDYMRTENNGYNLNQVGRNITVMKQYMIEFLDEFMPASNRSSFYLEMAFHDTHRGCSGNQGPFCNFWGNGTASMGTIPDWTPVTYDPSALTLPYWQPDTREARQDYADYLESYSRLDQGVGLFLNELKLRGYLNNTLIIFTGDNGEPFPAAKTNLYEEGQIEPFFVSIPEFWQNENSQAIFTDYLASTTDILPTILEWCDIKYPSYSLNGKNVVLTGESLLSVVRNKQTTNTRANVFGSHQMHEVTMYYPMRVVRTAEYRLIHNMLWQAPYHVASDIYNSPTWKQVMADSHSGKETHWFKNLTEYYFRSEWELFDLSKDPTQMTNLAYNTEYTTIFNELSANITNWVDATNDPWRNCNADFSC